MKKLTPFAQELKSFDKYHKLPLENPEELARLVSESFERIRAEDDGEELNRTPAPWPFAPKAIGGFK